jgi:flavin-dependent dehydrogenase
MEQGRRRIIRTIMGWWETDQAECDHLEFVFDRMLRPYYGWHFPEGPMRVNIGICYEDRNDRKNAVRVRYTPCEPHRTNAIVRTEATAKGTRSRVLAGSRACPR